MFKFSLLMALLPFAVFFGFQFAQGLHQLLQGEAGCSGARYEFVDELTQHAVALIFCVFDLAVGYECAGALLGVEQATYLHLAVGAQNCVGVDGEIDGNLSYGGELVSDGEQPGGDCRLYLVDELAVDRNPAVCVQAEGEYGDFEFCASLHESYNVLVV
jgi:hypothetical protein